MNSLSNLRLLLGLVDIRSQRGSCGKREHQRSRQQSGKKSHCISPLNNNENS